jgi:TRAP-type mannitol/chloroaromatic compound transport system substrate-binding protein
MAASWRRGRDLGRHPHELCAILAPETSGRFAQKINSPDDLKGPRMRIFGLGATVMQKPGALAQSMPVANTMTGLRLGAIDAAEVSFPPIDKAVGMTECASHTYSSGWRRQTSLIIDQTVWDGPNDWKQVAIQTARQANVALTAARGEAERIKPLNQLKAAGVTVHEWLPMMMDAFRRAWDEVAAEQTAADPDFTRARESLSAFRANVAQRGAAACPKRPCGPAGDPRAVRVWYPHRRSGAWGRAPFRPAPPISIWGPRRAASGMPDPRP